MKLKANEERIDVEFDCGDWHEELTVSGSKPLEELLSIAIEEVRPIFDVMSELMPDTDMNDIDIYQRIDLGYDHVTVSFSIETY